MAWATVSELLIRYPICSNEPDDRLSALLDDATGALNAEMDELGISYAEEDLTDTMLANLKSVACSMVARVIASSVNGVGVSQWSQTAGPVSQSQTFANASGDMYITTQERRKLGFIGRGTQVFYGSCLLGGD